MFKKAQSNSIIITAIIVIILAVISLSIVSQLISKNVEPQAVTSETVTGSNTTAVEFDFPDWSVNATCNCTNFVADLTAGTAIWSNNSCNGVDVTCSYSYFDGSYINNTIARTINKILPIVFAIFVLTLIVFVFVKK